MLVTAKTNAAVDMLASNIMAHAGETNETTKHGVPIFATQIRPIRVTAADYDTSGLSERVRSITDQEVYFIFITTITHWDGIEFEHL